MAKVIQLEVSYQRVLNLQDFNSVRVQMSATVEVDEGDNVAEVAEAARAMVKNNVMAEIAAYESKLQAVVAGLYMGLEVSQESE